MEKTYINKITCRAIAQARMCSSDMLVGYVQFEEIVDSQNQTQTHIYGTLHHLPPGKHAIHIHEYGNLIEGCKSLGAHYNPFKKNHGGRVVKDPLGNDVINFNRHVGDLGNIEVKSDGSVKIDMVDPLIKLTGTYNVIGRGLVIHKDEDDLGLGGHDDSLTTGHAGERLVHALIVHDK
jgi:superoxide dismutase, Cu-Zn family